MSYYGVPPSTRNHFHEPPSLTVRATGAVKAIYSKLARRRDVTTSTRGLSVWSLGCILSLTNLLTAFWFILLYLGESSSFKSSINACQWNNWENWVCLCKLRRVKCRPYPSKRTLMVTKPQDALPHHLVFIADPQLVDPHTYPGRPWPLSTLTIRHTDLYLRRAYTRLQETLQPDSVIFLGDLFDGGREWSTAKSKSPEEQWRRYGQSYWVKEYYRFSNIFFKHWNDGGLCSRPGQEGRKLLTGLPGNHDLGFSTGVQKPVRNRFSAYFGEGNRIDVLGNHTFISVDTVSLSAMGADSGSDEEIWKPTQDFLNTVRSAKKRTASRHMRRQHGLKPTKFHRHAAEEVGALFNPPDLSKDSTPDVEDTVADLPTILLSHVPLYRAPGTPCGPLREHWPPSPPPEGQTEPLEHDERNAITVAGGYQYQNVLTPEISKDITEKIGDIRYAFSGDDHDYCEVVHRGYLSGGGGIREITVKSMSWAMGVRRPGFLMVSLWNPVDIDGSPLGPGRRAGGSATLQTHMCLLPDQLSIFIRYGILFGITLSLLAIQAAARTLDPSRSALAGSGSPVLPTVNTTSLAENEKVGRVFSSRSSDGSSSESSTSSERHGLSVRSYNARTRSVSPIGGYGLQPSQSTYTTPLVDHPGYFGPSDPAKEVEKLSTSFSARSRPRRLSGLALFYSELKWSVWRVASVVLLWYFWLVWKG